MEIEIKNIIPLAQAFALKAFEECYTITVTNLKRPQIIHMQKVADLVWISGGTDEEIAAAWLHDTIEDTPITLNEIVKDFGETIGKIVKGTTDPKEFKTMPLAKRKTQQVERLSKEDTSVKKIKIADQISNMRQLAYDPTNEMTLKECEEYIESAKLVADACRGVSPLLDKLFLESYQRGVNRYKSTK